MPTDSHTIDHVVVTPHGIFVVETRARTRPFTAAGKEINVVTVERDRLRFPGWSERRSLEKVHHDTRWLAEWLETQCGEPVPVRGVLALPGWDILCQAPAKGLLVVSGETLSQQLIEQHLGELSNALHDKAISVLLERAALLEESPNLRPPAV